MKPPPFLSSADRIQTDVRGRGSDRDSRNREKRYDGDGDGDGDGDRDGDGGGGGGGHGGWCGDWQVDTFYLVEFSVDEYLMHCGTSLLDKISALS